MSHYKLFINDEYRETYETVYDFLDEYWSYEYFGESFDNYLDDIWDKVDIPFYGKAHLSLLLKRLDGELYAELFNEYQDTLADEIIDSFYLSDEEGEYELFGTPVKMKLVVTDEQD